MSNAAILRETFEIAVNDPAFGARFYERLFKDHPSLVPMFKRNSSGARGKDDEADFHGDAFAGVDFAAQATPKISRPLSLALCAPRRPYSAISLRSAALRSLKRFKCGS